MGETPDVPLTTRGILNPGAEGTTFQLSRHAPSADLAPFVERYWIVRWDLTGLPAYPQETLPYPCVNLAVEAGKTAVHGPSTRRFSVQLEGKGQVVGAKFKPAGFQPYFARSLSSLRDRVVPLDDVWKEPQQVALDLERDLLTMDGAQAQIERLEAFLRPRLDVRAMDAQARIAGRAVGLTLSEPQIVSVEQLAVRSELSVRSLQRLFNKYVGMSPKWVIRRFRMHEAAERVAQGSDTDWARLSQELGYFDQSHFIKDFKAQIGRSPAEYAALCARTREAQSP